MLKTFRDAAIEKYKQPGIEEIVYFSMYPEQTMQWLFDSSGNVAHNKNEYGGNWGTCVTYDDDIVNIGRTAAKAKCKGTFLMVSTEDDRGPGRDYLAFGFVMPVSYDYARSLMTTDQADRDAYNAKQERARKQSAEKNKIPF